MQEIFCNMCGNKQKVESDILMEDMLEITKQWGYFSRKDGEIHHFCLCEDCYDKITKGFVIPVDTKNVTEYL